MAELTVENLHLKYGDNPILKGVALTLNRGEVVSLLGPSGSGKTTLLRAVAGLEEPHEGSIKIGEKVLFDGATGVDIPAEGRNLGLVFQSYALWPHKTVYDNVAYGLKLRKIVGSDVKKRVNDALAQLSLGHLAERFPHQLSGGQQQRVALAMSDRILLLNGGKIEQQGTPQQMYSDPATLFTADFMGSNNRLQGQIVEVSDGSALLEGTGWKLWGAAKASAKSGTPGVGMIRLERIRIAAGPGDNHLAADLTTSM